MRELSKSEMTMVFGGAGSTTPTCPSGTTLTSVTHNPDGTVANYTCTPNSEVQKSDWNTVGAIVGAVAAVVAAVAALVALDT